MDGLIRKVRSLIIVVLLLFLASREYNISVPWKWYVQILLVIQIKINFIQIAYFQNPNAINDFGNYFLKGNFR